jgi:hypothetical protein
MSMRQEMRPDADLLEVRATGEFSLDEAKRVFVEMMEAVSLHKAKRVLFDGRTLTGNPQTMDRFYYAEFAAATAARFKTRDASGPTRFAYLLKEPVLDPERFGENVAANRGMLVQAFDDPHEARAWLGTPSAKNPGGGN